MESYPLIPGLLAMTTVLSVASVALPQTRLVELGEEENPVTRIIPDVDRDGYSDILVGSQWGNGGRVRLYSGRHLSLIWEVTGAAGADLGSSFGTIADLDRDGYPDVLAGAAGLRGPQGQVGAVHALSGRNGKVIRTYVGDAASNRFGWALAAGHIDTDGIEDFIVSAPWTTVSVRQEGRVYAISGRTGAVLYTVDGLAREWMGMSLANLGDLDGDMCDDFAIGSPLERQTPTYGPGSVAVISGRSGNLLYKVWGTKQNDEFGVAVDSIGDVDVDGFCDFVAGASQRGLGVDPGYASVISGKTGREIFRFPGISRGDGFGASVAGVEDIDGDRVKDLAVSAPQFGLLGPGGAGYVKMFSGRTGLVLSTLRPAAQEVQFGRHVGGRGDLDQDGTPDILITGLPIPIPRGGASIYIYSTRNAALSAQPLRVSLKAAGLQSLNLDAGAAHANRMYWMFGSATGFRTGISLPSSTGLLRLPLDFDVYTDLTIRIPNSSVMPNSRGRLDANGRATVQFRVPTGLPPLPAFTLHHAFLVFDANGNWVYASNPSWLRLE